MVKKQMNMKQIGVTTSQTIGKATRIVRKCIPLRSNSMMKIVCMNVSPCAKSIEVACFKLKIENMKNKLIFNELTEQQLNTFS